MSLNQRETEALDGFTKALQPIFNLTPCHPSDSAELVHHVHAIQNIVMARSAVRADLDHMTHMVYFCGILPGRSFPRDDEVCTETNHASPASRQDEPSAT